MKRYPVAKGGAGNRRGLPFHEGTGLACRRKSAGRMPAIRRSIA